MEESFKYIRLFEIYGKALTERKQEIFKQYYIYNLSLREVAKNVGISFQGVSDSLNVSKKALEDMDKKIGFKDYIEKVEKLKKIVNDEKKDVDTKYEKIKKLLEDM